MFNRCKYRVNYTKKKNCECVNVRCVQIFLPRGGKSMKEFCDNNYYLL